MDYKNILIDKKEGFCTVAINRPEKLNAMSTETVLELTCAVEEIAGDSSVRAVIITGKGRAFSAGGDLGSDIFDLKGPELTKATQRLAKLCLAMRNLPKPIIASVNGYAVGAGCNLALSCDILIASENAKFGEVFVKIGAHPDFGGTYLLPRLIGPAKACELIMTGKIIDAMEAERIGLVNKVVPPEQLEKTTMELAGELARGATVAIGMAKISIYQQLDMSLAQALEFESRAQATCMTTSDFTEGFTAFREKRAPQFKGI